MNIDMYELNELTDLIHEKTRGAVNAQQKHIEDLRADLQKYKDSADYVDNVIKKIEGRLEKDGLNTRKYILGEEDENL